MKNNGVRSDPIALERYRCTRRRLASLRPCQAAHDGSCVELGESGAFTTGDVHFASGLFLRGEPAPSQTSAPWPRFRPPSPSHREAPGRRGRHSRARQSARLLAGARAPTRTQQSALLREFGLRTASLGAPSGGLTRGGPNRKRVSRFHESLWAEVPRRCYASGPERATRRSSDRLAGPARRTAASIRYGFSHVVTHDDYASFPRARHRGDGP